MSVSMPAFLQPLTFATLGLSVALTCLACEPEPRATSEGATQPIAAASPQAPVALERRVVTLGGAITETSFALGRGEQVVGVDATSAYPEEAAKRPQLGYFRKVSAEGVLSLKPTHVFAVEGVGPDTTVAQLKAVDGLSYEVIPGDESVEGARERILKLGELWGAPERAQELVNALDGEVNKARERAPQLGGKRALFIYARGARVLMIAGEGTSAHQMLKLAGLENAVTGVEGFKPLTPEAVIKAAPEVVVMPEAGAQSIGGADGVFGLPGLEQTPAGRARALVVVDDVKLLGFGPRLGQALLELQDKVLALSAGAGDAEVQP